MTVHVVGAGGLGAEVGHFIADAAAAGGPPLGGFIDDDRDAAVDDVLGVAVVAGVDAYEASAHGEVVVAIGDCLARRSMVRRLVELGATFATVVHPTAYVAASALVGSGCVIAPFAYVGPRASVGDHTVVNVYASVGHDATTGPWTTLSPYATLNGAVTIEEGSFLGTGASVAVGRRVGRWAKLAAGAVVLRDVPALSLAVGNPARTRVMFLDPDGG